MTHHEIEEAVNQGRCSLLLTLDEARAAATLYAPDGTAVASADCPAEFGAGLRAAYERMFNETEARYSQKLCRLSALWVQPKPDGGAVLPPDAVDAAGRLTEAGVLLLDPARNLRPGVPVSAPPEDMAAGAAAADVAAVVDPAEELETGNIREDMDRERATGFDTVMARYRAGELSETTDGGE